MRVLMVMKQQINWQEQDLNQLAASQLELPRKRSGTATNPSYNWPNITEFS
jgi:hypothetical protein